MQGTLEAILEVKLYRFARLLPNKEELNTAESINDPKFRVSIDDLVGQLPELKVNPFATRLCAVFAQHRRFMVFEEFLDMMSVLSENAPKEVKPLFTLETSTLMSNAGES